MPRGHTAKTCSGRRAAQSGAVIIGRPMIYAQHPLLPPGARWLASRRPRAAAVSGNDDLYPARPRTFRSSRAVHRPATASSSCLPRPVQRLLPRAHRIRPPLLPCLVRGARPRPAGRPASASGALHPMDAGDPPVQALHGVPAVLRGGRVLPNLRPRRRPGALTRRACPPPLPDDAGGFRVCGVVVT
jgi:hypothetical protein